MINHVWTILCSQSVIDKDTNNISLQNVLEQLNISGPIPSDKDPALLPLRLELVSLWERIPNDKEARGRYQVLINSPSGATLSSLESDIDLSFYTRTRSRGRINGLQVPESGRYAFRILLIEPGDDDWRQVADIPLMIFFDPPNNNN